MSALSDEFVKLYNEFDFYEILKAEGLIDF